MRAKADHSSDRSFFSRLIGEFLFKNIAIQEKLLMEVGSYSGIITSLS